MASTWAYNEVMKFQEQKFTIPELKGISKKNIEEHLKLYAGYVKNANLVLEHINELAKDSEKYAYELGELSRRFSFEFNGMRNHEYYFESFVGGPKSLSKDSALFEMIGQEWGSFDAWLVRFKATAMTRGVGWAVLWYDSKDSRLLTSWIDEQHFGQLNGTTAILMLDMWEHSYVADYQPSGKKQYVEDFFSNLNWSVVEQNYKNALS